MMDFAVPGDQSENLRKRNKRKKKRDLATELKKAMKHEGASDIIYNWCA